MGVIPEKDVMKKEVEYNILKKITFLALLPEKLIQEGYELIKSDVEAAFKDVPKWFRFLDVVKSKWVSQPTSISMFGKILCVNDYYSKYLYRVNGRLSNITYSKDVTIVHLLSK